MTWQPTDQEFENVLRQESSRRYKYLIGRIADSELVWSLASADGWATVADDEGHEMMPIWPHANYAMACAKDEWDGLEAYSIPVSEWLGVWTQGLVRDNRLVAAFPIPSGKGVVVTPTRLKDDLEEALMAYE